MSVTPDTTDEITLVDPDDTDNISETDNPESQELAASKSRSRRWLRLLLLLLGLILGCALIVYPYVSDIVHKRAADHTIVTQQNIIEHTSKQRLTEEMQRAIAYNETLSQGYFDQRTYNSLLDLAGDGVMGTIVIPKIGIKLPIYHTVNDDVLTKGVGHMRLTSLPVGGPSTHAALTGHNGIPSMKIFDNADQLRTGDEFAIEVLGEEHVYRITSMEVTLPQDVSSLKIQPGKDLVTLITCTPYGVNTHRLLIHAERVSGWSGNNAQAAATTSVIPTWANSLIAMTLIGLAIGLGLLLALLLALIPRRKRKQEAAAQREAQEAAERTVQATLGSFVVDNPDADTRAQ